MTAMKNDIKLLYIDLFCGAGGTSTGVENAVVRGKKIAKVIACVNHDKNAIASHKANHPDAIHYTEDIRTLELGPMVKHIDIARKIYPDAKVVLWASLECTNFSRAKGGMSRDADSRTLAEHLFRYIEAIRPDIIQIENVDEFQTWGPLIEKRNRSGQVVMTKKSSGKGKNRKTWTEPAMIPDPAHKGEYYHRWVKNMCDYGYRFESRILNSADYGAYTSRKRFFGMFARPDVPMVFPEPTHAKETGDNLFGSSLQPWKAVREVLDLKDEGKSIFDRKKPLVDATLQRIKAGLYKFVAGGRHEFMIKWNSLKNGRYIAPGTNEPCPTVTTQNRIGLVQTAFLTKAFGGNPSEKCIGLDGPAGALTTKDHHQFISTYYKHGENRSLNGPAPTILTKDRMSLISVTDMPGRLLFFDNQYENGTPSSVKAPCGTLTLNPKQKLVEAVRAPWMMDTSFKNVGTSLNGPGPVITANRKWHYLVNPQFSDPGASIEKPCPTIIARQDKKPLQLAAIRTAGPFPSFIKQEPDGSLVYEVYESDPEVLKDIKLFMCLFGIVDITMRMLRIKELKLIQGFPEDYILVGSQEEQKKYLGNAVVTVMAKVWCEALVGELTRTPKIAKAS